MQYLKNYLRSFQYATKKYFVDLFKTKKTSNDARAHSVLERLVVFYFSFFTLFIFIPLILGIIAPLPVLVIGAVSVYMVNFLSSNTDLRVKSLYFLVAPILLLIPSFILPYIAAFTLATTIITGVILAIKPSILTDRVSKDNPHLVINLFELVARSTWLVAIPHLIPIDLIAALLIILVIEFPLNLSDLISCKMNSKQLICKRESIMKRVNFCHG